MVHLSIFAALAVAVEFSQASNSACTSTCNDLTKSLPAGFVKSAANPDAYWASQIQSLQGACYVYPKTQAQVATAIQTASKYQCQFAVRGSGHSGVPGASNLANGMVLNLDKFNEVTLSADKTAVKVGAGNQWGAVYEALDPLNYTVIGGRETTVGVSGLTLGGGISYFSGLYGMACDNVQAYDIVLANGTITTASQKQNADLYKALRGGGNNFGVVTDFHLSAYEYHLMQGGLDVHADAPGSQKEVIAAFNNFAQTGQNSPGAAMFLSLSLSSGAYVWTHGLYYTNSSPPLSQVDAYKPFFTPTLNATRVFSSETVDDQTHFAAELGTTQPSGYGDQFFTSTHIANEALLNNITNIWRKVVAETQLALAVYANKTNTAVVDFSPALGLQPLPRNLLDHGAQRGGNVLGISSSPPLMLVSLAWPWHTADTGVIVKAGMDAVIVQSNAAAKKAGLVSPFIYMNYAQPGLDVISSYGAANKNFLINVSKKYDPKQVFQKLVPGGFKLQPS